MEHEPHPRPEHSIRPVGNAGFWKAKLARNRARHRLVNRTLRTTGWCILRIWQHELIRRNETRLARRIHGIICRTPPRGIQGANCPA